MSGRDPSQASFVPILALFSPIFNLVSPSEGPPIGGEKNLALRIRDGEGDK